LEAWNRVIKKKKLSEETTVSSTREKYRSRALPGPEKEGGM